MLSAMANGGSGGLKQDRYMFIILQLIPAYALNSFIGSSDRQAGKQAQTQNINNFIGLRASSQVKE